MNQVTDPSRRQSAIVAGTSLLIMALVAGLAFGVVLNQVIVPEDAAESARRIAASATTFRLALFGFVLVLLLDIIVAWALYWFFRSAGPGLSALAAIVRLVYAGLLGAVLVYPLRALHLYGDEAFRMTAGIDYANALALRDLVAFLDGWTIFMGLFGVHLLLLGWLSLKTTRMPKMLGILLGIAGLCYVAQSAATLLMADFSRYKAAFEMVCSLPMALGELALAIWLLAKGGRASAGDEMTTA